MGGTFKDQEKSFFTAPYIFSEFPDAYDSFVHVVATGKDVDVYAGPDENSKVIARLNYSIVKMHAEAEHGGTDWIKIEVPPGYGYVSTDSVRSPIDCRAGFINKDGRNSVP